MLRGGTTCCNENYFFPDVQAATYQPAWASAPWSACRSSISRRPGRRAPTNTSTRAWKCTTTIARDPLVSLQLRAARAVHGAATPASSASACSPTSSTCRCIATCTRPRRKSRIRCKQHGQRPLARLDRLGLVNERLIAVHMTQLTDAEIALVRRARRHRWRIARNPTSSSRRASARSEKLRRAGVNLAIGTDGCASNNDLDMFGEMRSAALLAKGVAGDATALRRGQRRCARRRSVAPGRWASTTGSARSRPASRRTWPASTMDALETQPLYHVDLATGLCHRPPAGQRCLDRRAGASCADGVLVDMDVPALLAPMRGSGASASPSRARVPHDASAHDVNVSQAELDKFGALANRWWDPERPAAGRCTNSIRRGWATSPSARRCAARACSTSAAAPACSARRWRARARRSPRSTSRRT